MPGAERNSDMRLRDDTPRLPVQARVCRIILVGGVLQPDGMHRRSPWSLSSRSIPDSQPGVFRVLRLPIGILIFESNFLPKFLGVLMAVAGLGWLTLVSRPLA